LNRLLLSQDLIKTIYSTRLKKLLAISGVIISVLVIIVIVLVATGEKNGLQSTNTQTICMSKPCIKSG
jgi:hypothetical protein